MTTVPEAPAQTFSGVTPRTHVPDSPTTSSRAGNEESSLRVWVDRPDTRTTVVGALGDVDAVNTPRLDKLLMPRLETTLDAIVVDLSRVRFLGTDALHLLVRAHLRAQTRDIILRLVTGPAAVDRGLYAACRAAGLPGFASYDSLDAALLGPSVVW